MTDITQTLLSRLEGVKRAGSNSIGASWVARCPAHEDRDPSLTVTCKQVAEGEQVLIHCFAGCPPSDVLAAVGLEFKDLYPEKLGDHIKQIAPWLASRERAKRQDRDWAQNVLSMANAMRKDGKKLTRKDMEEEVKAFRIMRGVVADGR